MMTTTTRSTHNEREAAVIQDLQASFPGFGGGQSWVEVPDGEDPPDLIGLSALGRTGLELVEWLDGSQMGEAQGRKSYRAKLNNLFTEGWEKEYQPTHLSSAVIHPFWETKVRRTDEAVLRQEFWRCVEAIDQTWLTNRQRIHDSLLGDHSAYQMLSRYVEYMRFRAATQGWKEHGHCWIDIEEDGGFYDEINVIHSLKGSIEKKINLYSDPGRQAHLRAKKLNRLELLVHGGFNLYAHNTPSGSLLLSEIVQAGAAHYNDQPDARRLFDRIWVFNSLKPAAYWNQLVGLPAEAGRVRWLVELWPNYSIDPRSIG